MHDAEIMEWLVDLMCMVYDKVKLSIYFEISVNNSCDKSDGVFFIGHFQLIFNNNIVCIFIFKGERSEGPQKILPMA